MMASNGQVQRGEDDRLFCAHIEDLARQMQRDNLPCFTRFLDGREQALAAMTLAKLHLPKEQMLFYAGFVGQLPQGVPDVGRRMLGIFPDYLAQSEMIAPEVLYEQFPIYNVALFYRAQDGLTHRDLLGSLMGLGLKREMIGEILTGEDLAVLFCTQTAQDLILSELDRVGRAGVRIQPDYCGDLPPACRLQYRSGTVSSLRLDCVVSLMLNLSREKSAALIEGGQVNLNFFEQTKISKEVAQGDILSIRGYGRFVLVQIGDKSKKGRLHLTVGQYV